MTIAVHGIGIVSDTNIAIGKTHCLKQGDLIIEAIHINKHNINQEVKRLAQAIQTAKEQLLFIRSQNSENTPEELIALIDTHILMLEDEALIDVPIDAIKEKYCTAEWALQLRKDELITIFDAMDDPYLRAKKEDISQVIDRIQRVLLGFGDICTDDVTGRIIITDDLSPADAMLLCQRGIKGFVTEHGGPNSHTAILAKGLGIPAIVAAHGATHCFKQNDLVVLDANTGTILSKVNDEDIDYFNARKTLEKKKLQSLIALKDEPCISLDGIEIELTANIETPSEAQAAAEAGAEGIGLYRTEFLFMNRQDLPTEQEHYETYLKVINETPSGSILIRTLDIGADKQCKSIKIPGTSNPALGLRAIRLCLKEPQIFQPQLRAILRAAKHGNVKIMIPMLTNVSEIIQTRKIINETVKQLNQEGIDCDSNIEIGGMIEIPAAALAAKSFAEHLDFFSIGTNDLIQYTLAIDRIDDHVGHLYDPQNPAVIRLIKMIIDAGDEAGIPVSMCGEMAADKKHIPLLLALGLRKFSMHPNFLLSAKEAILQEDISHLLKQGEILLNNIDSLDIPSFTKHISIK